jgi:hypothetical protein
LYLRELGLSLLRRWYFVVVGLLITGGLTYMVFDRVPISYTASASTALLPPPSTVGPGGNPFLYMGGLNQALDVLSKSIASDQSKEALLGGQAGYGFDVGQDPSTSGPILLVTSKAPTAAGALSTMHAVLDDVPKRLLKLQVDLKVPPASRISSTPLAIDAKPTMVSKTRTQFTGAVGVAGLAVTILLTGLLDGIMINRRNRRAAKAARKAEGSVPDDSSATDNVPDDSSATDNVPEEAAAPEASPDSTPAVDLAKAPADKAGSAKSDRPRRHGRDSTKDDTLAGTATGSLADTSD